MENNALLKKQKFSFFDAALACVIFIVLNFIFMQAYTFIPPSTIGGNIVIPEQTQVGESQIPVEAIPDEAFYACTNVKNIVLPASLKSIGRNAFSACAISTIFLPNSVETILASTYQESPFYACSPKLVIYLEAPAASDSFGMYWNYRNEGEPLTVKYGYSWEEYLQDANITEADLTSTDDAQVSFYTDTDGRVFATKGKEGFSRSNPAVYLVASFLIEFVFAIAAYMVAGFRKVDLVSGAGLKKKVNVKIVLLCACIAIISIIGLSGLTNFFLSVLSLIGYQSSSSNIVIPNFGIYLVYVLVSCIAPAVFEELLFRGVILSGLKDYGKKIAIVLSAVIFMLMHGSPDQTVHQFIIGLIVGYIFFNTGNLWLGAIVHFFNNFIAITELYVLQGFMQYIPESSESTVVTVSVGNILFSLVGVIISAIIAVSFIKYIIDKIIAEDKKLNPDNVESSNDDLSNQSATILVNGEEVQTEISISSPNNEPYDIDKDAMQDFQNDELFAEMQSQKQPPKENKDKFNSFPAFIMMGFSIGYLVLEWIIAFIGGI